MTQSLRLEREKEAAGEGLLDRRSSSRQKLVLRIGIVEFSDRASFCILQNISPCGVKIKFYSKLSVGNQISLRVGEQAQIKGKVVWVDGKLAGIEFDQKLPPEMLLRVEQKQSVGRRRGSPRINTQATAKLRTCGRAYTVVLSDISTSGAKLKAGKRLPPSGPAILELPELPPVSSFIRWSDDQEIGLSFGVPIPVEIMAQWLDNRPHVTVS